MESSLRAGIAGLMMGRLRGRLQRFLFERRTAMSMDSKAIRKKYTDVNEFLKKEAKKHRCACGCKQVIQLKSSHYWNGIPHYIFGHAAKLRAGGPSYDKSTYYSVKDIAEHSGASEQTVRLWMRLGKITSAKIIGRKNLFLKTAIDDFIKVHPQRKIFEPEDYISVKELKKMGISRSKLRFLVRNGQIGNPRIYARKTHYLRDEITQYKDQIMEDRKTVRHRTRFTAFYKELLEKISLLDQRISAIENKSTPKTRTRKAS
jgi:hypothetical protein